MSKILFFVQHHNGKLLKASLVALSAAQQIKQSWSSSEILGVCLGEGAEQAAQEAATYGLSKVYHSDHAALAKYLALPYEEMMLEVYRQSGATALVGAGTSLVKDLFPRIAAKLEAGQASDVIGVNGDGTLKRPMYAGNALADVEIVTEHKVVTIRPSAFSPAAKGGAGSLEKISHNVEVGNGGEVVSYELSSGGRPELTDAEIVVSGGRALQSAENFEKYIFPLADSLGAAVGASRAAVDSGYAPNDWQVGQTGKVVAPNLYMAVGISGAIQHLAGMKDSKLIVAVNKDADAPIFEVADYGLVADLYTAVPELTEAIKKVKNG
jgi:electron transfer flavoprotein alpha subunit